MAEKAHRRGDSDKVLSALDKLASYFQVVLPFLSLLEPHITPTRQPEQLVSNPFSTVTRAHYQQETADYKTSIYFYERCLDIAESMDDLAQQGNANLNLGSALITLKT